VTLPAGAGHVALVGGNAGDNLGQHVVQRGHDLPVSRVALFK
jgi:hypothetical protein